MQQIKYARPSKRLHNHYKCETIKSKPFYHSTHSRLLIKGANAVLNNSRQIHIFSYGHNIIYNSLKKLPSVTRPSFSTNARSTVLKSGFKNIKKKVDQKNCVEATCSVLKSKLQAYKKNPSIKDFALFSLHAASKS